MGNSEMAGTADSTGAGGGGGRGFGPEEQARETTARPVATAILVIDNMYFLKRTELSATELCI
ncbi:MAG: hypothetical protein JKY61_05365 [Planctomycetes bacterium]|nr:hypothetical protein [Planctomycetota bacterium]